MPPSTPDPRTESAKKLWYAEGLAFQCTGCGDCCTGTPGYVWVNQEEMEALAANLDLGMEEFQAIYTAKVGRRRTLREKSDGSYDCIFLDQDRRCTVYRARPRQCKTWPFWGSNVKDEAAWKETCESCPGAGTGKLYTVDEIETARKTVRI
jgi:Fe-S-cluster containining protein